MPGRREAINAPTAGRPSHALPQAMSPGVTVPTPAVALFRVIAVAAAHIRTIDPKITHGQTEADLDLMVTFSRALRQSERGLPHLDAHGLRHESGGASTTPRTSSGGPEGSLVERPCIDSSRAPQLVRRAPTRNSPTPEGISIPLRGASQSCESPRGGRLIADADRLTCSSENDLTFG